MDMPIWIPSPLSHGFPYGAAKLVWKGRYEAIISSFMTNPPAERITPLFAFAYCMRLSFLNATPTISLSWLTTSPFARESQLISASEVFSACLRASKKIFPPKSPSWDGT